MSELAALQQSDEQTELTAGANHFPSLIVSSSNIGSGEKIVKNLALVLTHERNPPKKKKKKSQEVSSSLGKQKLLKLIWCLQLPG